MLIPRADKKGYALASELLFNHKGHYSSCISEGGQGFDKIDKMLGNKKDGTSSPMVESIFKLVQTKVVSKQEALRSSWRSQARLYDRLKTLDE